MVRRAVEPPLLRRGERAPASGRPFALGERGRVIVLLLAVAIAAWFVLGIPLSGLVPQAGGVKIVRAFFGRALHPAFTYEDAVPEGTPSVLATAFAGARRTIVFATAGMSLALVIGIVLGFLASSAWWSGEISGGGTPLARTLRRFVWPSVWATTRVIIVVMRSVHELLWAVLFLAAFGLNTFGAVIAIAIPFGGTLAKIFSEMIDEAPRDSANALRGIGAPAGTVFFFGLLPRALPDMCAYSFYRYECAIRSSAVLGFFGFPTLGYSIFQSFENLHFGEVWTYLYTLMILVIAVELWSAALRTRFVA
jgi:phosphonate transport system permease protein